MIILTIRTDKPEAEIGLYNNDKAIAYKQWQAHRQLAETIHKVIWDICAEQSMDITSLQGIVCFEGPGSFTGLRIGLSVGNALAHSLGIPIVAIGDGEEWQQRGISRLVAGEDDRVVMPEYGAPAFTTKPKK